MLCLALATCAFAMFAYVSASIATHFVGRDAEDTESARPAAQDLRELRREIALLRL